MSPLKRERCKVALISLGCPKNQVDAENMLTLIEKAGYALTDALDEAEGIVVNTCGFIQAAKEEAIAAILEAADYKVQAVCRALVVSGCLAQRYAREIVSELPEVDAVLGIAHYRDVVEALDALLLAPGGGQRPYVRADYCREGVLAHLQTERRLSDPNYAYLKISEGCRHHCAYCAIPGIRGAMISRPMEALLAEAEYLLAQGIKELIVVSQDTTSYGLDLYGERRLPALLEALARLPFKWIRFLYAYADGLSDELLAVLARHPNLLHYIDLPIQHASDAVLRRMRRRDTQASLRAAIGRIRAALPDCTLRSTVMLGFPGEREEDVQALLAFVEEIGFDMLGAFVFSPEEGTAAAALGDQVDRALAEERYGRLMRLQEALHQRRIKARVGQCVDVLIEAVADDGLFYKGRSSAQAPEIDSVTYVLFERFEPRLGEIYPVTLLETRDYDYIGVCQSEPSE